MYEWVNMTPRAVRLVALSLPEAHEEPHFERTSFRVGKKIFATMTIDGAEGMIRVKPASVAESLIASQPKVFFSYGAWTSSNGALGVRFKLANVKLVEELLREAWKGVAPKRLVASTR